MAVDRITLTGHLTEASLAAALAPVTLRLESAAAPVSLIVDALEMTGYDLACRHVFTAWNKSQKGRIARVAIVTEKTMWRAVIAAMSLASGQTMKAFRSVEESMIWMEAPAR
jgi:hypothetical protein